MMRAVMCVVVALGCSAPAGRPGTPRPTTSASTIVAATVFDTAAPPALRLPGNFVPEGYVARLAVDPAQPKFGGSIAIRGDLTERSAVIWLHGKHLTIAHATATEDAMTVPLVVTLRGEDLLELRPAQPLPAGHYVLALDYTGEIQPDGASAGAFLSKFGDDGYVTTEFEATSARLVFPCVDEPGSKVPWQLTLDVPKGQVAVSNAPVTRETPLDATHVRVAFAPTRPLPSYLIAFGVGPYELVDAGHAASGTPLRLVVPRGQAARAAYAAAALPKIVDALAAWTDVPFPYPKLDVVARDAGGAMENAGLIMMDSSFVLLDGGVTPSAIARHEMISVVGHETAHQWFGDLVTAAWWDDIWLNEAFATFMEDKVELAVEPSWHDDDMQLARRYFAASVDAQPSARQIRQPVRSEGDIHNAFDTITYFKGGAVIAMFEAVVGPEAFQRGIRAYLREHADHNATATQLIGAVDGMSAKRPVAAAFASFLDQPGIPELALTLTCAPDQPARVTIAQHRYLAPGGIAPAKEALWKLPLCVAYETAAHARGEACGWVDQASVELALPDSACPAWVLPDAGAHAYARTALTAAQATALRDHGWPELTWRERRGVFDSVQARAADGALPVALLMSFVPRMLQGARFEIDDALGDASGGYLPAAGLPAGLDAFVPLASLPAARARVRALIAPLVHRLGLVARPTDTLDDERARIGAVEAAQWAGDPSVARQAVALAARYRELPPALRGAVLSLAATASPAIAAQLRADAFAEGDPERRQALFAALGSIGDAKRLRAMLDAGLDPRIKTRDLEALLTGWRDEGGRAVVEPWFRAHLADIERTIPTVGSEDSPPLLRFLGLFTAACDGSRRDELVAYMTATFGALPSAARPVQNAVERLDQCIARRKLVEPSLRAWLSGR